jgi:Na+-translocating ferredoxin:NAD+ oxidoreductase RnfE subunit
LPSTQLYAQTLTPINNAILSPKVMFLHHQCLLFLLPPSFFIITSLTCTVKEKERERDGSL